MKNTSVQKPVIKLLKKQRRYSITLIVIDIILLVFPLFLVFGIFGISIDFIAALSFKDLSINSIVVASVYYFLLFVSIMIWILNIVKSESINSITKKDVGLVMTSIIFPGFINLILAIVAIRRERKSGGNILKNVSNKILKEEIYKTTTVTKNRIINSDLKKLLDKQVSVTLAMQVLIWLPIVSFPLWILSIINASKIDTITKKGKALIVNSILFPWLVNLILAITTRNKILEPKKN